MALLYGFGDLIYIFILLINAVAVLNEERFLARIGWSASQTPQQTYNGYDQPVEEGIKSRIINLIAAVRTLLRSESVGIPRNEPPLTF
ncbi:Yos1-domain-containing protein [Serendipita vermifera]|nr:Yos1-domain-containing protein [Serendipita vermifera]